MTNPMGQSFPAESPTFHPAAGLPALSGRVSAITLKGKPAKPDFTRGEAISRGREARLEPRRQGDMRVGVPQE